MSDPTLSPESAPPATCTTEEFLPVLWERLQPLLRLSFALDQGARSGQSLEKRAYGAIAEEARELEIFLDDHGAWSNRTFISLIEYAATVRGFAIVGHTLTHVLGRLGYQYPTGTVELGTRFREGTSETRQFIDEVLGRLTGEMHAVARQLYSADLPPIDHAPEPGRDGVDLRLKADLDEYTPGDRRSHVIEIAGKFLAHKKILERESKQRIFETEEEMKDYVARICDEEECRYFETRIQNLLGRYDTYVKGSRLEAEDQDLSIIRGYVAIVRRLARVITELIHFFERHENDVRSETLTGHVLNLVDQRRVLDRALNYALYYMHVFMDVATPLIHQVVERYTKPESMTLSIPDDVHLHIRPVSLIAKIVEHHKSPVDISVGDTSCFAGSIVQVLMAVGAHPGLKEVTFEGDQKVLEDIKTLFQHGLGERGLDSLPPELSFLRG